MNVVATACAMPQGGGTFEIALVLDNTGSMGEHTSSGDTKIQAAKNAAVALIKQLNAPGAAPMASFSVVPFTTSVNVGAGFQTASWMNTGGASSIHWQNYD